MIITALPLAPNNSDLIETAPLIVFGFPLGRDLAFTDNSYPSITVSTGRVTALRKADGVLASIQLDASVTHGNSGGPVMDSHGKVVGIIEAGIKDANLNMAVPVEHLQYLLNLPRVLMLTDEIPAAKQYEVNKLEFMIDTVLQRKFDFQPEFQLYPNSEQSRSLPMTSNGKGLYVVTVSAHKGQAPGFKITVKLAGKVVSEFEGVMPVKGALVASAPASIPSNRASVAASSAAGPYLYEGFDYAPNSGLNGQAGGKGNFNGAWSENIAQGSTSSAITIEGLTFGNLKVSGYAILTTSDKPVGHSRKFAVSPGKVGGVLFISYLVKPIDAMNAGYPDTYFGLGYGGVSFGKAGKHPYYGIDGYPGGTVDTSVEVVPGKTAFLVARITFGAPNQNDVIDLFVNPTPGKPLPAQPDASMANRNTRAPGEIGFGCSIRCIFDEIRIGRTFAEVAPTK